MQRRSHGIPIVNPDVGPVHGVAAVATDHSAQGLGHHGTAADATPVETCIVDGSADVQPGQPVQPVQRMSFATVVVADGNRHICV